MNRIFCLLAAVLLLAMTACSGGGSAPAGTGLTPLDFDVTTDATSTVGADDVIGYAVERTNPMFADAETKVPAGYALAALLKFEPETAEGAGFSGDFTVRTPDRSVSAAGDEFGAVYLLKNGVIKFVGSYAHGTGGAFRFHLNSLGVVMLLKPTGSQFQVAAFADIANAQVDTEIHFWALARNGVEPVTYTWDFGDGNIGSGPTATHMYPFIGSYNVSLTAVDANGNLAPVASTPINVTGNPVALTAVSVDVTDNGDGSFNYWATANGGTVPFTYEWDFEGNGNFVGTAGAQAIWSPRSNLWEGRVRMTDQTGTSAEGKFITDARQITVFVTLDGSASSGDDHQGYAPDVAHITVETEGTDAFDTISVDFGDGSTDTYVGPLQQPYPTSGIYQIVASVTRDVPGFGDISKQSAPVSITIDPRPAPVIESVSPARGPVGTEVTLTGNFFFLPEVDDEVLIGLIPMPVVSWDPQQIVVTVPQGARDGEIIVRKGIGALDSNPVLFDVAPTPPGQPGTGQL